ncbi:MAG: discoidin domain-containing protein [Methylococcales bacterium]|nr:discoidin domain-containing protein [Methylococcales bacterium]
MSTDNLIKQTLQNRQRRSLAFFVMLNLFNSGQVTADDQNSKWDGPYSLPLVAAAAANLPDGRILTWAATAKMGFVGPGGRTYTSIFDPTTGLANEGLISNTGHDMFCPGTAVLPDGRIMVTGGSNSIETSFYHPESNIWTKGPSMNISRGYHSMATLNDGSVFTVGGSWSGGRGMKDAEVWNEEQGWVEKPFIQSSALETNDSAGVYRSDNHMWFFTAPNGLVFHAGPSNQMNWIDTSGNGNIQTSIMRGDDADAMNGNAVMYDVGKILTVGGAPDYNYSNATNHAYIIDVNGGVGGVTTKRVANMAFARAYNNSVVLPSGEVVVIGGQKRAVAFSDAASVFAAEIWSPETEVFTTLSEMSIPRNYHSVALLMKDARVFVSGGGLCGGCSTNHPDVEILTPPYLLNSDGSPAIRPIIEASPSKANLGDTLNVAVDTTAEHSFVLTRTAIATHSVNNDERRIPLEAVHLGGGNYQISIPSNSSIVIPGNYFLFALNDKGVPSIAKTLNVNRKNISRLVFGKASQSSTGWGGEASRANDGNTNGNYYQQSSVSHTELQTQPWWQLDLESTQQIDKIKIYNRTDCCTDRLANVNVFVSNVPFGNKTLAQLKADSSIGHQYFSGALSSVTSWAQPQVGRYIRIQLEGTNFLSLAEVEVFARSSSNKVLTTGTANQSSIGWGGEASRANDGNIDGNYRQLSVSHTALQAQPWWQLDMKNTQTIDEIKIYNRTDCCTDRLVNVNVFVSNIPFGNKTLAQLKSDPNIEHQYFPGILSTITSWVKAQTGRYVRVQLEGSGFLSLAEVEVLVK